MLLHLFLFPFVFSDSALTCAKYVCTLDSLKLSDSSYCVYTLSDIHYLNVCNSISYSCQLSSSYNMTKCTYTEEYTANSVLPGGKCIYASDCISTNDCINNICVGSPYAASCTSDYSCAIGLSCKSNSCTPQIRINAYGCMSDTDCDNNATCNIVNFTNPSQNQCIGYFSQPLATVQENELACISGFIYQGKCAQAPVSVSLARQCSNDSQCTSESINGVVFNSTCQCGYNPYGNGYCALFYGDSAWQKVKTQLKNWIASEGISKCHTSARFDENCIRQNWSENNAKQLNYDFLYAQNYAVVQGAETCALRIFTQDYYMAMAELDANALFYGLFSLVIYFI